MRNGAAISGHFLPILFLVSGSGPLTATWHVWQGEALLPGYFLYTEPLLFKL